MTQSHPLLSEIRDFLSKTGMSPSYFGKLAANNSELVRRLEAGGDVRMGTADRVRAFMAESKGDAA